MNGFKKIISVFLITILLLGFCSLSYATTVTKENLQEIFDSMVEESEKGDSSLGIKSTKVEDDIITIVYKEGNKEDAFHYDLTDNPKFWTEITINNGMTYEGNFENGYKEGKGKLVFEDGSNYEGSFKLNNYEEGKFKFKNGRYYSGK